MMPMFCAMQKEMQERIEKVGGLDCAADFVDDGVDGGDFEEVYRILEKEIRLGTKYGLRNNFDKMVV